MQPQSLRVNAESRCSLGLFLSWCYSVASGRKGDGNFSVPKERGVPHAPVIPKPGKGAHGHMAFSHNTNDPTPSIFLIQNCVDWAGLAYSTLQVGGT